MVENKTLKINIGEITKDPEMLRLVPHYLKTKNMWNHSVKMLPFLIKYVRQSCSTKWWNVNVYS